MQRNIESHTETLEAICWDVLPDQKLARCKIQGTNEFIVAHYPLNWEKDPVWRKPGNSVTISHTGGIRARVELIGHGAYIPTPVEGATSPTPAADPDAILWGCGVLAVNPAAMCVGVAAGAYRIGGETYYLGGEGGEDGEIPMEEGSTLEMDSEIGMGTIYAGAVNIDAAPTTPGNYRYDLIVVGADGVLDYVKGTESADPVVPSVPASHLECGRILLFYGMTEIGQIWINKPWSEPIASSIYAIPDDDELAWAELTADILIGVKDQYGNALAPETTWPFEISFTSGNGNIGGVDYPGTYSGETAADHYEVTYTRDQEVTDVSPLLSVTLLGLHVNISTLCYIVLLDAGGDPMF